MTTTPQHRYNDYEAHIARRWQELGVPAQTAAIRRKHGNPTQEQINRWYDEGNPKGPAIGNELFQLQARAFHRILGEMYWLDGRNDVGAGRKTDGHNWKGMAEDIVVLKPVDAHGHVTAGPVRLVDAVVAMGGVDAEVAWHVIDPNPDRTWVEPHLPDGEPIPGPRPPPPTPIPGPEPEPEPGPPPPPLPPPPPPIEYRELLELMKELSDVYRVAPGWQATFEGLAEVTAHWTYLLLVKGYSVESIREDYVDRKREANAR